MIKSLIGLAAFSMLVVGGSPAARADMLEEIKDEGRIVVGVKADYKPWGFRDESGNIIGLEVDLARDVADRLGVELELVPTQSSNRVIYLDQDKIDLILATMSVTPERARKVGIVEPYYYASGTNVLAPKSANLEEWEDLRGKKVCGTQGAYYNKRVAQKYGAEIVAFAGIPEAHNALLQGNCVAFLQDSTLIEAALVSGDPNWADYEMPLPTEDLLPWGIAVPLEERDKAYGQFISDTIEDWHKTGKLIEMNEKYGLGPNPFLQEMHEKYKTAT